MLQSSLISCLSNQSCLISVVKIYIEKILIKLYIYIFIHIYTIWGCICICWWKHCANFPAVKWFKGPYCRVKFQKSWAQLDYLTKDCTVQCEALTKRFEIFSYVVKLWSIWIFRKAFGYFRKHLDISWHLFGNVLYLVMMKMISEVLTHPLGTLLHCSACTGAKPVTKYRSCS